MLRCVRAIGGPVRARPLILLLTALLLLCGAAPSRAQQRRLVLSEDFNGPAGARPRATRWNYDLGGGGWGNRELEYYTRSPRNAALDGHGHLVISARAEPRTDSEGQTWDYTSARLQTRGRFEFEHGLVEARIRVPAGAGLLPAFWMLGDDAYEPGGWPGSGEIDAMEILGSHPETLVGSVHGPWPAAPSGLHASARSPAPLSAGFHVYGVSWSRERVTFLLDGVAYRAMTPADLPPGSTWPFERPNFLVLDVAVGGNWPGWPSPSTRFPARMLVDWVRVWR
jgi:beta-glucanase (GH16 family)